MFIEKLVKALVPSLERNEILEDIDSTVAEINEFTLPPYNAAFDSGLFGEQYNPKSKWLREKQMNYTRSTVSRIHSLHMYIHAVTATLPERLERFRELMEDTDTTTVVSAGIDYKTANLIQFISISGFISRYARKFLLLTYCHETPEYVKRANRDMPFSRIELKMLEDQYDGFMEALHIFSMPTDIMIKKLADIPEYVVDDTADDIITTTGSKNLEPIAVGFIPYRWNPIYHVRMAITDWQHSRYLAAKDERQALDLRLLAMRSAKDNGSIDPTLEKQIKYTEDRVMKLNRKIGKAEEL